MFLNRITKRASTVLLSGLLGVAVSVSAVPMPTTSAMGIGDIVGIGVGVAQVAQQKEMLTKQYKYINTTEEGREMLFQEFRKNQGVNDDPELNGKLDIIMGRLSEAVAEVDPTIKNLPYKYFINMDKSLNASCAMGHVMTVNTGTFYHLANDDEIAAVVGHEMGHGQKDHVFKSLTSRFDKELLASIGVALASGSNTGALLGNIVGNLALKHSIVHADKRHEWEADGMAFEYITHTDYNPGACAAVMQRFIDLMGTQKQSTGEMLFNPSDHPNSEARRDKYVKQLGEYSGNHVTAKNGTVFVNGNAFVTPAPAAGMSAMERSYFVFGNLAAAYHNHHSSNSAYVENGTVMLGPQAIFTPTGQDESADVLAERLNSIKDLKADSGNKKNDKKDKKAK